MTRDDIVAGLSLLVEQLSTNRNPVPDGWEPHTWAYIKGLASGQILQAVHHLATLQEQP